jgi:hypothetical protein
MAAVATLPRLSQLNIEMDSAAKTKLRSLVEARAKSRAQEEHSGKHL